MQLDNKAYNFAQKILNVFYEEAKPLKPGNVSNNKVIPPSIELEDDPKRIIGSTNYKKFENMAKEIDKKDREKEEKEKIERDKRSNALKMGCNNDLRKERQLMDKPVKDKIEASKIFKTEGDDFLRQQNYEEAIHSYEKGMLQLFYTFSDDPEEEKEADKIKELINMNCSMCLMKQGKYDEALGCLNEALRVNKQNLKAIYRSAYCYFMMEKFEDSKEFINMGLKIDKDNKEFTQLMNDIIAKENKMEKNQNNLYKKMIKE